MAYISKHLLSFGGGILLTLSIIAAFSFKEKNERDEPIEGKEKERLQHKWYAPELPTAFNFAGERVPLERQDIREQLDREVLVNYYSHYSTIYNLKLAGRYFPIIEARLKANGIPDDFKYLCVAESALQNQISKAGAVGFWQFMPGTAPMYGLEVNDEVDERYDMTKATDAACKYFIQAYNKFGSWTAAAASYNCGMGGYTSFTTFQQTNNYYDTQLPEETMRYVFRILAFKYILKEADKMGFVLSKTDIYKPYKTRTVIVTATIPDLAQYAIENGITYRTLKQLNPWLRDRKLTVKKDKSYAIAFPAVQ